jgi:hypothetical protein
VRGYGEGCGAGVRFYGHKKREDILDYILFNYIII